MVPRNRGDRETKLLNLFDSSIPPPNGTTAALNETGSGPFSVHVRHDRTPIVGTKNLGD